MGNIWDLAPIMNQKDINRVACTCCKLTFNIPNWIYMQKETEILSLDNEDNSLSSLNPVIVVVALFMNFLSLGR